MDLKARQMRDAEKAEQASKAVSAESPPAADESSPDASVSGQMELPDDVRHEVDQGVKKSKGNDVGDSINALVKKLPCFKDQYGEYRIEVRVGNRYEYVALDSTTADDHIRKMGKEITGKYPSDAFIKNLKTELRIKASSDGNYISVHQRICKDGDFYYLDMGDSAGRMVKIGDGDWDIVEGGAYAFVRSQGYKSLPVPVRIGCAKKAYFLLSIFLQELGIPGSKIPLVIATLVCWYKEGSSYPILALFGAPGSGKSTAALLILMLVDPPPTDKLPSVGSKPEHIAAAAQSRGVITFDNVGKLSADMQDTFCIASTGGEIVVRGFYEQGKVVSLPIHRAIIITSVVNVLTRPDALSRGLSISLPVRESRCAPDDLIEDFKGRAGELFGALLEMVAASTVAFEYEDSAGHRLHDFIINGQRIFHAIGKSPSKFTELANRMRDESGAEIAAGDSFVSVVRSILNKQAETALEGSSLPGYKSWFKGGVASVSLQTDKILIGCRPRKLVELISMQRLVDGWLPSNERQLGDALLRATPLFGSIGIEVRKRNYGSDRPYWEFTIVRKQGVE